MTFSKIFRTKIDKILRMKTLAQLSSNVVVANNYGPFELGTKDYDSIIEAQNESYYQSIIKPYVDNGSVDFINILGNCIALNRLDFIKRIESEIITYNQYVNIGDELEDWYDSDNEDDGNNIPDLLDENNIVINEYVPPKHIKILEQQAEHFKIKGDDDIDDVISSKSIDLAYMIGNNYEVIDWICENIGASYCMEFISSAMYFDNFKLLSYLLKKYKYYWKRYNNIDFVANQLIRNDWNDIDIFNQITKYCIEKRFIKPQDGNAIELCYCCCLVENFELLKWLRHKGFPWEKNKCIKQLEDNLIESWNPEWKLTDIHKQYINNMAEWVKNTTKINTGDI